MKLLVAVVVFICGAGGLDAWRAPSSPLLAARTRCTARVPTVRLCMAPAEDGEAEVESDAAATAEDEGEEEQVSDELLNSPAFLRKKVEVLEEELEAITRERNEALAKIEEEEKSPQVLRLQADFENLRRRTAEQMAEQVRSCAQSWTPSSQPRMQSARSPTVARCAPAACSITSRGRLRRLTASSSCSRSSTTLTGRLLSSARLVLLPPGPSRGSRQRLSHSQADHGGRPSNQQELSAALQAVARGPLQRPWVHRNRGTRQGV